MTSRMLVLAAVLIVSATTLLGQDAEVYRVGNGVSAPTPVKTVKPNYTPEAEAAKIQGTVQVEAVVREDGAVGDTTVTRSLDAQHGLDGEAVKAANQWTFKPGMKDGKPVPVLVTIEMTFTLPKR